MEDSSKRQNVVGEKHTTTAETGKSDMMCLRCIPEFNSKLHISYNVRDDTKSLNLYCGRGKHMARLNQGLNHIVIGEKHKTTAERYIVTEFVVWSVKNTRPRLISGKKKQRFNK